MYLRFINPYIIIIAAEIYISLMEVHKELLELDSMPPLCIDLSQQVQVTGSTRAGRWHDATNAPCSDGLWADGPWPDGPWANAPWANGPWPDGAWANASWTDAPWPDGPWANASWPDGTRRGPDGSRRDTREMGTSADYDDVHQPSSDYPYQGTVAFSCNFSGLFC